MSAKNVQGMRYEFLAHFFILGSLSERQPPALLVE
jgi:hypothetical protein